MVGPWLADLSLDKLAKRGVRCIMWGRRGLEFPIRRDAYQAWSWLVANIFMEEVVRGKVYEFFLIAAPLKLKGATGSPLRLIALV